MIRGNEASMKSKENLKIYKLQGLERLFPCNRTLKFGVWTSSGEFDLSSSELVFQIESSL